MIVMLAFVFVCLGVGLARPRVSPAEHGLVIFVAIAAVCLYLASTSAM